MGFGARTTLFLVALVTSGAANAATVYLNVGESFWAGDTQVVCQDRGGGGGRFEITSYIDLTCYENNWRSASTTYLQFDQIISNLRSCRSGGTFNPSRCVVTATSNNSACQDLARRSFTSTYFSAEQAAQVANDCRTITAQCEL